MSNNKISTKVLSIILIVLLSISNSVFGLTKEISSDSTTRFEGQDRYETSKVIAEQYCDTTTQNVILTSGNNFPDALASSVLASKLNAPILLVNKTASSTKKAFEYIANHLDPNGRVYLIGGTGIIKSDFHDKLKLMGFSAITQIGGKDRYETSLLIAKRLGSNQGTPVIITTGLDFPNALTISSFAAYNQWPMLLVDSTELSESMKEYITTIDPSEIYIAGTTTEVKTSIENQLKTILPSTKITRMSGTDRYSTLTSILQTFSSNPNNIYVASGTSFPDALAGSVLAAKTGSPIVLLDPKQATPPRPIVEYLKNLDNPDINVFGGPGAVPQLLVENVQNTINGIKPVSTSRLSVSDINQRFGSGTVFIEAFDSNNVSIGVGSGFLVDDNKVVTNYHVIEEANSVKVTFSNGETYTSSELFGYNQDRDISVIKIPSTSIQPIKLGDSSDVLTGEDIVVIGNPLGLSNTVSTGNISSTERFIDNQEWFQITASVSSGSSGGPVFNHNGEVIGIVTWGIVEDTAQNLNFIIPINTVKNIISNNNSTSLSSIFSNELATTRPSQNTNSMSLGDFEYYIKSNYFPLLKNPYIDYYDVKVEPFTLEEGFTSLSVAFFLNTQNNSNWLDAQLGGYSNLIEQQLFNIHNDLQENFPQYQYYNIAVYYNDYYNYYPSGYNSRYITYLGQNEYQLFYYKVRMNNWSGYLYKEWNNNIVIW